MPRAEDSIDMLIERLSDLPDGDRRAVMRRLSPTDAARVTALLVSHGARETTAPCSPAIAARIANADTLLTPAAAAALTRAVGTPAPVATPHAAEVPSTSLLGAARRWLAAAR